MRFRKTNPGDLPQLKSLWALGFGDTEQEIEAFFAISYPTATGFCAEEDGKVIAAAYALPQEVAWGEKTAARPYLYAVTTHPDFRKQGICESCWPTQKKELTKRYFDCLMLRSGDGRAAQRITPRWALSRRTQPFLDEGGAPEARGVCEVLTPADYAGLRETVLYDTPHVRYRSPTCGIRRPCPAFTGWNSAATTAAPAHIRRRYARRGRDLAGRFCAARAFKKIPAASCRVAHGGRHAHHLPCANGFRRRKNAGCLSGL